MVLRKPKAEVSYVTSIIEKQPAVIVIQEWWGVDDQIKVHAAKIASKGYRVLIPDLYETNITLR